MSSFQSLTSHSQQVTGSARGQPPTSSSQKEPPTSTSAAPHHVQDVVTSATPTLIVSPDLPAATSISASISDALATAQPAQNSPAQQQEPQQHQYQAAPSHDTGISPGHATNNEVTQMTTGQEGADTAAVAGSTSWQTWQQQAFPEAHKEQPTDLLNQSVLPALIGCVHSNPAMESEDVAPQPRQLPAHLSQRAAAATTARAAAAASPQGIPLPSSSSGGVAGGDRQSSETSGHTSMQNAGGVDNQRQPLASDQQHNNAKSMPSQGVRQRLEQRRQQKELQQQGSAAPSQHVQAAAPAHARMAAPRNADRLDTGVSSHSFHPISCAAATDPSRSAARIGDHATDSQTVPQPAPQRVHVTRHVSEPTLTKPTAASPAPRVPPGNPYKSATAPAAAATRAALAPVTYVNHNTGRAIAAHGSSLAQATLNSTKILENHIKVG